MSAGQIDTALLRAAQREFVEKILPGLTGENRYTGAMLKRALDVLLAQATSETAPDAVPQAAGFGAPGALAAALRADRTAPSPALLSALRGFVEAKLRISNPKFLEETRNGPEGARS
ncbi:DUF6285 domain-containing protein [Albidovulum sediminicola]|uniref:DUF6285 domain-containing protein n=1 Tax=Albidovulum sediminicola TaxID=2984331 RepID=A0ABT2Z4P0_9RHOB|nr:DUF6285 domain-containing protein [Defluviimonas sp. WL0075]MCV2866127.1 DUF6285 domain-containing protein [Defluviimonas sp. WL0075]